MNEDPQSIHSEIAPLPSKESATFDDAYGLDELLPRLKVQRFVGHLLHFPFTYLMIFVMRFVGGWRIRNIQAVRRQFRHLIEQKPELPLILCGNHLTYADSAILIWALAPMPWYFLNYRYMSWNLPAGDHFKKKWIFRVIAYLAKCIFIHRDGDKAHQTAILNASRYLIQNGEAVTIFPEGKRSRTGQFETHQLTYGVGKILSRFPQSRVICFYLRGHKQNQYSAYAARGSQFYLGLKQIFLEPKIAGREAYADIVTKIGATIKQMELDYFRNYQ